MSKMGEELERRLDENKYDLHKACKSAYAWYYEGQAGDYRIIGQLLRQVLAKIEGKPLTIKEKQVTGGSENGYK